MEWNFKLRQTCTFHVNLNVWELWCSVWGETVVYGGRLWCMGNCGVGELWCMGGDCGVWGTVV